jgi:hypothetical protein
MKTRTAQKRNYVYPPLGNLSEKSVKGLEVLIFSAFFISSVLIYVEMVLGFVYFWCQRSH